jgi:hypothetical protein
MFTASQVPNWMVIIYERQPRFNEQTANQMAADLVRGCEAVGAAIYHWVPWQSSNPSITGIQMNPRPSLIKWESGQGNIGQVCHLFVNIFQRRLTDPTATSCGGW